MEPPGYGLDLALGCDIRIAADSAKLNPGFAKRGILPESGGTWLLPRIVGYAKAAEIAFTGRTLTADEALELGLVNQVVPAGELTKRASEMAGEIAANAPLAVRAIKRMMRAAETETFEQNVHHVFLQLLPLLRTDDFTEGVTAFMEKRTARVHRALTAPCRRSSQARSSPARSSRSAPRRAGHDPGDPPLHRRSDPRRRPRRRSCGTPVTRRRVPTVSRSGSSCCATVRTRGAPAPLLGASFRSGWKAKRRHDGYRPSRFADSMQHSSTASRTSR